MDAATTILLSLGLAADAFAVAVSSGLAIKHMKVNKALKIALFFGGFQALMPVIGWLIGLSFSFLITPIDHWIAFGLLSFIGGRMIYESLQSEECEKKFNPLDTGTLITLSVATSIDALAVGLGFAVLKDSIALAVTAIGFITFFLAFAGVFIGHKCGNLFANKIEILGGAILIFIGSRILFLHLTEMPLVIGN
ncbi:manganese efflux pump MntP [Microcoleus vaginatus]|jgi:putative Mn2+ efflux pump MntP|uniref:manganese efflux pump MntP n=1 Tax=Microcoleus vaginatus TaxID=119532 RepID=UPI001682F466|nr:manganese efflux pump [Microcoleus sp. FACHB-DQ6]MBD1885978.1 manganese efflux pump [Microcoleus sp. FACHB-84]MBD2008925.1 manganese efflux pump [Microcoleus sp. FACHB-45]